MKAQAFAVLVAILPVQAFAIDCEAELEQLANRVPPVSSLDIEARSIGADRCQVKNAAISQLRNLEWRTIADESTFQVAFKHSDLSVRGFQHLRLSGGTTYQPDQDRLSISLSLLSRKNLDTVSFSAQLEGVKLQEGQTLDTWLSKAALDSGELLIDGSDLLAKVLADAFKLDLKDARNNFSSAREQRETMLIWLDTQPSSVGDFTSRAEFREMIAAYPRMNGQAKLSLLPGGPVEIGQLLAGALLGKTGSKPSADPLQKFTGLTFKWIAK